MTEPQTTVLETERLILRRLTTDDADALFALYRDPEVRKYFPEGTLAYAETKAELAWSAHLHLAASYPGGLYCTVAIVRR